MDAMKRSIASLAFLCGLLAGDIGVRAGTTTLVMNMDVSNGIIAPAGPSRVRVPPAERVTLILPDAWQYPIQWTRNGTPIAGATNRTLSIPFAAGDDRGLYGVTGAPFPTIATGIDLDIVPVGHLSNVSARVELGANGVQIVGFVVTGRSPKALLYRAVGPTLSVLGVTNPAHRPQVHCFDANGREVTFVHPAMVIELNALFQSVGAFPVSTAELSTVSYDYGTFSPGAYTLHVSDATSLGGTALVEVYEMP